MHKIRYVIKKKLFRIVNESTCISGRHPKTQSAKLEPAAVVSWPYNEANN